MSHKIEHAFHNTIRNIATRAATKKVLGNVTNAIFLFFYIKTSFFQH